MSWRATLPCTRAEADATRTLDDPFGDRTPDADPPTLVACEACSGWELQLFSETRPGPELLAALARMAPSATAPAVVEPLADADWVTLSQAGLEPVNAGRFHVHTFEHRGLARPGQVAIRIDAGLAFGTGQHATTRGCLMVIDRLARQRRFESVLDLGTGSGVLAFAAQRVWRRAAVTGSDIDPVAVAVARANARLNGVPIGRRHGSAHLLAAPGMEHGELARRAPYDLILANILAGPLVALAPGIAAALAPGGTLVLAGLIASQARRVTAAYAARGLKLTRPVEDAEWPVLEFTNTGGRSVRRGGRGTAGRRPRASAW